MGNLSTGTIVFNPGYNWTTGTSSPGQVLIQPIALHELGHWLTLKDLYGSVGGYPSDTDKVMFGFGGLRKYEQALAPDNVAGIRWIYANGTPPPTPTPVVPHPYPGPHVVPGGVEAEDYDAGGEGVAYHDTEPANLGGAYRPSEGVDIETANGLTDIGWTRAGEWLVYTVTATTPQDVVIRLRVSNPDASMKEIPVLVNGEYVAAVWVPSTGSFGDFTTVDSGPFSLPAGDSTVRLVFEQVGRVDLDSIEFAPWVPPPPILPVPGGADNPFDLDGDGLHEDVNANMRQDFADVVWLFAHL